jgi:hypothetical protein
MGGLVLVVDFWFYLVSAGHDELYLAQLAVLYGVGQGVIPCISARSRTVHAGETCSTNIRM